MPSLGSQNVLLRLGLISVSWLAVQSTAYAFHSSCQGTDLANVQAASKEAIAVLEYAQDRVRWGVANQMPAPYQGTLVQDMMGANDAGTWANAKAWFGVAVNNLGPYSATEDDRVLIYCSDAHLTLISADTGYFRDQTTGSTVILSPLKAGKPPRACSGDYQAFGYLMSTQLGISGIQKFAIVLCPGTLTAPTESLAMLQDPLHNHVDTSVASAMVQMTSKILHEFVHVAGIKQFPRTLPGGGTEVYGYEDIARKDPNGNYDMPKEKKLQNADSFAILAVAWYANLYYVDHGVWKQLPKRYRIPNPVPANVGAVDAPSPDSSSGDSSSGPPPEGGAPPRYRVRRFTA